MKIIKQKQKNKYTFTSVCVHIQNIYSFRILSNILNLCCGQTIDLQDNFSQY